METGPSEVAAAQNLVSRVRQAAIAGGLSLVRLLNVKRP